VIEYSIYNNGTRAIKNNGAKFPVSGHEMPINNPLRTAKPASFNFCMEQR
jgi:hypothetical protein